MQSIHKYFAFISYKHEDVRWAKWLHRKIEGFRLPAAIRKSGSPYTGKLPPVFLDTHEIQPGPLKAELKEKLEQSKYLIVICSPCATKSKWVGEEIAHFISLGRTNDIIPVIIEGAPYTDDPLVECFHAELKKDGLPEFLGVDINAQASAYEFIRKEMAFIRVMSKMLHISFDALWQRHRRRKIKQAIMLATLTLSVVAAMAGIWKYNQSFDAQLSFHETTIRNENLGFPNKDGTVSMIYNERDTLMKTFKNLDDRIVFNDIPGRYRNAKTKFRFCLYGFADVDTVMTLKHNMTLPVKRDGTFGRVQGEVRDYDTDLLMEGVQVEDWRGAGIA